MSNAAATGELAALGAYHEARAPDGLPWVDRLWSHRSPVEAPVDPHRVLPNPATSLCFRYRRDRAGRVVEPGVLVVGPVRRTRIFAPEPGTVLEAVQIRPEWASDILGIDPAACADVTSGDPLSAWRDSILWLALDSLASRGTALPGLMTWVEGRGAAAGSDTSTWLAGRLFDRLSCSRAGPGSRLGDLATHFGVSARHLRRAVTSATGVSPKYLQRVIRLNRAVAEADKTDSPPWATLASAHGYYDQAHLISEVRELSGLSPSALHRERRSEHVRFFQFAEGAAG